MYNESCEVSAVTVYRWIEKGKILPILKIRPFKIPRSEIAKLLSEG
jgi:predicted site-specific integrase-resolvase